MLQINTGASVMHRHRLVNVVDAWSGRQVDGDAGGEIGRSSAVNGRLYQASNKQGRPDNPIRLAMFSSAVAGRCRCPVGVPDLVQANGWRTGDVGLADARECDNSCAQRTGNRRARLSRCG
jgi:glycogen synthase